MVIFFIECGRDNRNLKDNGVKQKLTRDDIQELKKEFSGSVSWSHNIFSLQ